MAINDTLIFDELAGEKFVPGFAVETDLTRGVNTTPSLEKKILLLGYKLSTGSAVDHKVYPIYSEKQARQIFGAGSTIAVMAEYAFKQSRDLKLYGMSYAEGGGGVKASGTVTLATTATGAGVLKVWLLGRLFQVAIANTNTPTTIGDALVAKINGEPNLPVTAANSTGTVTITARNKGTHGNSISIKSWITPGIGMTSTDGAAYLASGATDGDCTTALTMIEGERYHLIVSCDNDSTNLGAIKAHQVARSAAAEQRWGNFIAGYIGTLANAITLAGTTVASIRGQIVWLQNADQPTFVLAAAFAGERARTARNLNRSMNYHSLKGITAPLDATVSPTEAELDSALQSGVSPLRPKDDGTVQVVRSVVSLLKASAAYLDTHKLDISDFIDEDIIAAFRVKYADSALKTLSAANTPNVLTQARAKALLISRLRDYESKDYIQGTEAMIEDGRVVVSPSSQNGRLDLGWDFIPVDATIRVAMVKRYTEAQVLGT